MSRLWTELARTLEPYVPGEQPRLPGLVKLNTNESPLGPSPRVVEAIRAEAADTLRLYPDPESTALRIALAAYHGVRPEQVFVGNGSDEVLAHAFAALLKHDAPLVFPDITYSFYPVYCRLFGVAYETVPLDAGMRIGLADYDRPAGAIILANPNAPTGVALGRAEIAALLVAHPDIPVVIDEAYVDFGAETAIPLIADHPNLLVVQTLSKSRALAGLRVGCALGDAGLIEALGRVKNSFNSYPLGRAAQAGAIASVGDEAYFQASRATVIAGRARLAEGLAVLGFEVLPSAANFVFARHPGHAGAALAAALRERAVLVRHFAVPRISDYLRITVGDDAQIGRLFEALREILGMTDLRTRLRRAWQGRISGCQLGKPVEILSFREGHAGLTDYLRAADALPLRDYIAHHEHKRVQAEWCRDALVRAVPDDDINYSVLALMMLEQFGRDLTTADVARTWLKLLPAGQTFTAERAAYGLLLCRGAEAFAEGAAPGFDLAECSDNPYSDWIGAQIRADVYGWVTPGRPALAADLARRDADLSHRGDGVHGAAFVAALGAALATEAPEAALALALAEIPADSEAAGAVRLGRRLAGDPAGGEAIRERYKDLSPVHTVNNLALVVWALYSHLDDFGAAIGEAVAAGLDTDCNGATVGALWGLQGGDIPEAWTARWRGRVGLSLAGYEEVSLDSLVDRTAAVAEALA